MPSMNLADGKGYLREAAPMTRPEVLLSAGEFYFFHPGGSAAAPISVRTLLGSCVSIVLRNRLGGGGMSHSVLPARTQSYGAFDGNHCEGAVALILRELERSRTTPRQYETYLLGGSRMSYGLRTMQKVSVGERNVDACRTLLLEAGFAIAGEHVGGTGPRRVSFDLCTGRIEVLHDNWVVTVAAG
jgi:chemotaxis protein CheD